MKHLTNTELTTFCSQFAMILRSGISSLEGLSIMADDTPEGEGKKLLTDMLHEMEQTGSLHQTLVSSGVFPDYLCHMVEIGEQSGRLDDVMESLGQHYKREEEISQSIKSAVAYPLVMLGMMLVVVFILIIKVLPVFNKVFEQLGTGLTGVSGAILNLGNSLGHYSIVFLLLAVVISALVIYFVFSSQGRKHLTKFSRNFFLTRKLNEKIACSRFASGMYLSLCSGLDTDQSLEMVARLVEHPVLQEKIKNMQELMIQGMSFADALTKTNLFSGIYSRMISIGFKAGAMDEVMKQISEQYDAEITTQISTLISRLEPTLVAILSIIVGMILLSVMLPLMGIMSNIG
nr:type II secretion system F family protein [uncultured Sellimonas sp.]